MCNYEKKCCECGCTGPQGPQGVRGEQGPQGMQGPSGKDGSDGMQGIPGVQGQTGPTGPTGSQGSPGIPGVPGTAGINGLNGSTGSQGPKGDQGNQGPQGPQGIAGQQGIQGLQGIAGENCECNTAFLSIYSLEDQTINSIQSAFMELVNINSSATDFDITLAPTSGEVTILKHGVYDIEWGFDGKLTPPYPFPVPAWALGIYRNGILIPGSVSGSFSITPDDLVVHDSAEFMLEFFAGDVIKLVNIGTMAVNAVATTAGVLFPIASVRLNILKVKSMP